MRDVKMKWGVAVCAVGLLLGGPSIAAAVFDVSVREYLENLPGTSADVTTVSFDLDMGEDGWTNGTHAFRLNGRIPDNPFQYFGIQVRYFDQHYVDDATGVVYSDWIKLRSSYGPYWVDMGTGGLSGSVHYEIKVRWDNGLVSMAVNGDELDFIHKPVTDTESDPEYGGNDPGPTNNPQPNGQSYSTTTAETVCNTFWSTEDGMINPVTQLPYAWENAFALGWWDGPTAPEPPSEAGIGGNGYYQIIFEDSPGATADHLRPGIPGDANLDGTVDDADASIMGAHWLQTGITHPDPQPFVNYYTYSWQFGDFNGDTNVDDADAAIFAAHYGTTASLELQTCSEQGAVPEPSMVALLTIGGLLLAWWERKGIHV